MQGDPSSGVLVFSARSRTEYVNIVTSGGEEMRGAELFADEK